MLIGRVIGNVVSTIKHSDHSKHKLMLVQPLTPEGRSYKKPIIAIDVVDAGPGEVVFFVDEGNAARQLLGLEPGCVRAVIVGFVDEVQLVDEKGCQTSWTPNRIPGREE